MIAWNPWHGCRKISTGCLNCYVYRRDESIGKDAGIVSRTGNFSLPEKKRRTGEWKLLPDDGPVYVCMTSDFFLEEADEWRPECWRMIRQRPDLQFFIITKRIVRAAKCMPEDWGDGYSNVTIICTVENQKEAHRRLPVFLEIPVAHKQIIHEPMLEAVDIGRYLASGQIEKVQCGGESGEGARLCCYDWVLSVREQCIRHQVAFQFRQTGARFRKDGRTYRIRRQLQESQAVKAGIDYDPELSDRSDQRSFSGAEESSAASGAQTNGRSPAEQTADFVRQSQKELRDESAADGQGNDRIPWSRKNLFERIAASRFRSRFHLTEKDRRYVREKGMQTIRRHAEDFIGQRLAPSVIPNDGKQTPMRGHPVFPAQHACACCCRGCLQKWHGIPPGIPLSEEQQQYIVNILMEWIRRQMKG